MLSDEILLGCLYTGYLNSRQAILGFCIIVLTAGEKMYVNQTETFILFVQAKLRHLIELARLLPVSYMFNLN